MSGISDNKEGWVGTWRPHKPRGPIAALYGSPGPKYGLPSLTGVSHHDPTKSRAPMFSFGRRQDKATSSTMPGPSYLIPSNITKVGRDGTPAFSLYGRPKEAISFQGPGPDQYYPERSGKSIFRTAPSYSLSGRGKESNIIQTPGPTSYQLPSVLGPKTVDKPAAPAYSLSCRARSGGFGEDGQKSPGPATYKVVDPCIYNKKTPQYSMTGRNFTPGDNKCTPGPGAHSPEQVTLTKTKAPSFTFGLRHSPYMSPLTYEKPQ